MVLWFAKLFVNVRMSTRLRCSLVVVTLAGQLLPPTQGPAERQSAPNSSMGPPRKRPHYVHGLHHQGARHLLQQPGVAQAPPGRHSAWELAASGWIGLEL